MSSEEIIAKFKTLGLNEQKAKETLKNGNVTKSLLAAINEVRNKQPVPISSNLFLLNGN